MQEENYVEHKVVIDEYITARIKIPKELTALDLKSLMNKANKLFNLSETPLVAEQQPKEKVKKVPKKGRYPKFSEEVLRQIYELKESGKGNKEISKRTGLTASQIGNKVWKLKSDGVWHKLKSDDKKPEAEEGKVELSRRGKYKHIFSPMDIKTIYDLKKRGKTRKEISQITGFDEKQISDKIYILKKKGQWDL